MATILPDCQMPDGADPCKGYAQLYAENERLRAALLTVVRRGTDDRWYTSQHGDADVTAAVGSALGKRDEQHS